MSGAIHLPLLAPEHAGKLLDEVIYERVLGCIDVDALLAFECELSCAIDECGLSDDASTPDLAKEMIERALQRVRAERWEVHLRAGRRCDLVPWDCELCDEAPAARGAPPTPVRRSSS